MANEDVLEPGRKLWVDRSGAAISDSDQAREGVMPQKGNDPERAGSGG